MLVNAPDIIAAPAGVEIIDFLHTPSSLPEWVNLEDLQSWAEKFNATGFTGALNYYRAMDKYDVTTQHHFELHLVCHVIRSQYLIALHSNSFVFGL